MKISIGWSGGGQESNESGRNPITTMKFIYIGTFRYEMFLKTSCFNSILMKCFWKNMYGNSISKSLECPKSKKIPGAPPLDPVGGAYSAPPNPPADSEGASLLRPIKKGPHQKNSPKGPHYLRVAPGGYLKVTK